MFRVMLASLTMDALRTGAEIWRKGGVKASCPEACVLEQEGKAVRQANEQREEVHPSGPHTNLLAPKWEPALPLVSRTQAGSDYNSG